MVYDSEMKNLVQEAEEEGNTAETLVASFHGNTSFYYFF